MALQYNQLVSQSPSAALELLKKASADEIKALIARAKAANKPLLGYYIYELLNNKQNQPEQTAACIKILLNQTQGNWDHEFPANLTSYFASLSILTKIDWTNRIHVETFAGIIYRLTPAIVIRDLQLNVGRMLSGKKSLYTYLLENRPASNPVLLAISAVLGQATTQEVQIFKNEINQVLTKDAVSKDHQVLLLKHDQLFESNTRQFLNNSRQLSITGNEFDQYTDIISYKRCILSGRGVPKAYVQNMIVQPQVFIRLLTLDKLSVDALIPGFEATEITQLITAMKEAGMNPLELLIRTRSNRSPAADKILFDAILNHAYFSMLLNNGAGDAVFEKLLEDKDTDNIRALTAKIQAFTLNQFNQFVQKNEKSLGVMTASEENALKNGTVEAGKTLVKSLLLGMRIENFKAKPADFADLMKTDPLLAGRYMECMDPNDCRVILHGVANFSQAIDHYIVQAIVSDVSALPDDVYALPNNAPNKYADYYFREKMLEIFSGRRLVHHHSGKDLACQAPAYYAATDVTTEQTRYAQILALRILGAVSSALHTTGNELTPNDRAFAILCRLLSITPTSHPEFSQVIDRIFNAIPAKVLIATEIKCEKFAEKPGFDQLMITPVTNITWLLPHTKGAFLNLLQRCEKEGLNLLLGHLLFKKDRSIGATPISDDKDLITQLYQIYPEEMVKCHPSAVLQFGLTSKSVPLAAPAPVGNASSSSRAAMSEQHQIAHLKAELDRVTKERDALKAVAPPTVSYGALTEQLNSSSSSSSSAATYLPSQRSARTYNPPVVIEVPIEEDELGKFVRMSSK